MKKTTIFAKKQRRRMVKKALNEHLKALYEGQEVPSSEDSPEFVKNITGKKNPGIALAKKNGVAYTVIQGSEIVRIDAEQAVVIGHIANGDVKVQQRIYSLK